MTDPKKHHNSACLYIIATPIGNIRDISQRAIETLQQVDLIAAEDTRHSQKLCREYAITTPMMSLHDHNEEARIEQIAKRLSAGESVALISDAGTPLISDPGFKLVRELRAQGFRISPIPGASAVISALSVAGLPTDSFSFFGFLPSKSNSRKQRYQELSNRPETLVFYESSHRIKASLQDALTIFGNRNAVIARELTKNYETILSGTLEQLVGSLEEDNNQSRGEFVLIISGQESIKNEAFVDSKQLLSLLLNELPPNKASKITAQITGENKQDLYRQALEIKG